MSYTQNLTNLSNKEAARRQRSKENRAASVLHLYRRLVRKDREHMTCVLQRNKANLTAASK